MRTRWRFLTVATVVLAACLGGACVMSGGNPAGRRARIPGVWYERGQIIAPCLTLHPDGSGELFPGIRIIPLGWTTNSDGSLAISTIGRDGVTNAGGFIGSYEAGDDTLRVTADGVTVIYEREAVAVRRATQGTNAACVR